MRRLRQGPAAWLSPGPGSAGRGNAGCRAGSEWLQGSLLNRDTKCRETVAVSYGESLYTRQLHRHFVTQVAHMHSAP